ncbi:TRAF-type zinc finger domain containing 1 [Willisornis vidua]|uniref:TRAF-type zinc finger domain-containing protein 1 n=1 Tax=Willisornis vidua TaxID=1566151 RepID=A0ABQ9DE03_9PASS|nr:TRAF-type zinc finger domain containing 1 [Willisornis vidua]
MAIAAAPGDEARLCGNCKKDIPAVNFLTHEIHCRRNIEICPFCSDSVPKSEMKNHVESEHVQASACPLRRCPCRFCDIPLAAGELDEHESYCGARTERCARCGHHVLLRDRPEHPRHCGTRPAPPTGPEGTAEPRGKGDELEKKEIPDSSLPEEWNADLDYVLALSLQDENNPPQNTAAGIPRDLWEYDCPEEPRPSAHLGTEPILLPCEFCEQLCPAEELILHQTGCNPASAFASFSKRSSSPKPWEFDAVGAVGSNSSRTPPASQPQIGQAEGDILIPCEFCGIQLEEQVLFHHQAKAQNPGAGSPEE